MDAFRRLVVLSVCLTFVVVVVGAWVRLADAGLGCPDWPGCYGKLTPDHAREEIERAVRSQGGDPREARGPVSMSKAWKEMGHRYLAGVLGVLILAIAAIAWLRRARLGVSPWLPTAIVIVVGIQATLGKWTVTMLLKPAIVTSHLAGGMTTLGLLVWLALRLFSFEEASDRKGARSLYATTAVALAVLCVQILLGGWVSTNYAALACPELPLCRGALVPAMDFGNAFHVVRELGMQPDGALLSGEALAAIHWTHRAFALLVAIAVGLAGVRLVRQPDLRLPGWLLLGALGVQLCLGAANVALGLPLALAAAHNGGAAALLVLLVVINFLTFHGLAPRRIDTSAS